MKYELEFRKCSDSSLKKVKEMPKVETFSQAIDFELKYQDRINHSRVYTHVRVVGSRNEKKRGSGKSEK